MATPRRQPASGAPASARDTVSDDEATGPTPGDGYVQSFARGLGVIRAFTGSSNALTLSKVAERAGLTRAGARRILLTLAALGYVQVDDKRYALTPRILDLGFAYLSSQPLWKLAEPELEALSAQVGESCSIGLLDGPEVIYVMRVAIHKIMNIDLSIGSRLPVHCTSMGRVLLGGLGPDELAALLAAHPPTAQTARTVVDPAALTDLVHKARTQGWCLVDQELANGLVSIAAPIRDRAGRIVAALNVSGQASDRPARRMREQVLEPLLQTAGRISGLLAMK